MLNTQSAGNSDDSRQRPSSQANSINQKQDDPLTTMKKQMLVMDSLEKARDPQYQANLRAEERLKKNKEKLENFLNSTLTVNKASLNPAFNSISRVQEDPFIKAVIDEDIKGFLGSRIRFRLLENITVGKNTIPKGHFLYAQISGFEQQRVNLNVVSVLSNGEILPINLSVYDLDGMKGLYVPESTFREMLKEMGTNSVQGTQLDTGNQDFFTSLASKLFSSTSTTIANMIKKNKAKLKYNSYLYLVNEKQLKKQ
jgi:conjugative transposon TraM protein